MVLTWDRHTCGGVRPVNGSLKKVSVCCQCHWLHKTSLPLPLFLTCMYQARTVSSACYLIKSKHYHHLVNSILFRTVRVSFYEKADRQHSYFQRLLFTLKKYDFCSLLLWNVKSSICTTNSIKMHTIMNKNHIFLM
jgi:hypothetical protein